MLLSGRVFAHEVIGSIPLGETIELLFQLVLHNWYSKSHCMYYLVLVNVHIEYFLLLTGKRSP